jgi:hypothetical protein
MEGSPVRVRTSALWDSQVLAAEPVVACCAHVFDLPGHLHDDRPLSGSPVVIADRQRDRVGADPAACGSEATPMATAAHCRRRLTPLSDTF